MSVQREYFICPQVSCVRNHYHHVWPRVKVHLYPFHVFTHICQRSQVDLLAKSEIFDGITVACDVAGITLLEGGGGSRGMLTRKFWKMEAARMYFNLFWAEMWCDSELESAIMCGESMLPVCGQHEIMWTCGIVI